MKRKKWIITNLKRKYLVHKLGEQAGKGKIPQSLFIWTKDQRRATRFGSEEAVENGIRSYNFFTWENGPMAIKMEIWE